MQRQLFRASCKYNIAPFFSTFGSKIDDPVGAFYNLLVMFYKNNRMTVVDQGIDRFQQLVYIVEMQSRGRFVKNEQYMPAILSWLRK